MTFVPSITFNQITFSGDRLVRPECVIASRNGDLYASHGGGGITHISPDGKSNVIFANNNENPNDFIPNGYSLQPDGAFLIANLGQ